MTPPPLPLRPPVPRPTLHARPKGGHRPDEYEDAAAFQAARWPLRLAVADGATESAFAGAWARHLVQAWISAEALPPDGVVRGWQAAWEASRPARQQGLPWYAAAKAEQGAYAALLGAVVHADGTWEAWSVGDCALLLQRGGTWQATWPFDTPDAFTATPALLSTRSEATWAEVETTGGTWLPGDVLILATDALAAHLLAGPPPADLAAWTDEAFMRHTQAAWDAGSLRNDDLTLLVLPLPGA